MHEQSDPQTDTDDQVAARNNRSTLLMTAMALALAVSFASMFPLPLMPVVLSQVLLVAAAGTAAIAVFCLQRPLETHLNLWDKAILLGFAGLVAGSFVDAASLSEFFNSESPTTSTAPVNGPLAD